MRQKKLYIGVVEHDSYILSLQQQQTWLSAKLFSYKSVFFCI